MNESEKIIKYIYEFSPVVSMGMLGSLARIINDKKKDSFGSVLANMIVASFIAITIKLITYNYENEFLIIAIVGIMCFNSKQALLLLSSFASFFMKSKLMQFFSSEETGSVGNSSDSIYDADFEEDEYPVISENTVHRKHIDQKLVVLKRKKRYAPVGKIEKIIDERKRKVGRPRKKRIAENEVDNED